MHWEVGRLGTVHWEVGRLRTMHWEVGRLGLCIGSLEVLDIYTSGEEGDESSSEEPETILVPKMVRKHF